jgi:hypothetical protein
MPEVIIYNALESVIKYVRRNLSEKENESDTVLYRLLGEDCDGNKIRMNRWNFFEQAKKIFTDKQNLSVNFGYNFEVAKIISLHIILPSEEAAESAIGQDEGYIEEEDSNGNIIPYFTQNFHSNYQIMITSNNSSEVLTVYHILKSLLLMIFPHLEIMGLRLNKLSGNDVLFKDDMMPNGIFHKVLNLNFNYELRVPQNIASEVIKNIHFFGEPLDDSDKCSLCDTIIYKNINQ